MKTTRILFCGGGTGGHITPLAAVAETLTEAFSKSGRELEMHYLGGKHPYTGYLSERGVRVHRMLTGKFRRYFSLLNFIDVPKFLIGLVQAWCKLYFLMPDAVFSKGGPGALPVVWAAWFYRIPVMIHDSDAIPGLTTLFSAPFAKKIAASFEDTLKYFNPQKAIFTGNPVRKALLSQKTDAGAAKSALGFDPTHPLILVLGGSQGARRINELVTLNLKPILEEAQVLHQAGGANFLEIQKLSEAVLLDVPVKTEVANRYRLVPYLEEAEMASALSAADLVISRPGSSIFEIAAFGKPSILIPLDGSARDHQRANAHVYGEKAGAGIVIEEGNLNVHILIHEIKKILGDPDLSGAMSQAALRFARPDAADLVAKEILELLQ